MPTIKHLTQEEFGTAFPKGQKLGIIDMHNGGFDSALSLYQGGRLNAMVTVTPKLSYDLFLKGMTLEQKKVWEKEEGTLYVLDIK